MDLAPAVGVGLAGVVQELLQALGEDLGAAAGHRVQARRLEPRQRLARLDLPAPPQVVDLRRRERLDLGLRPRRVDGADEPLVVLEGPVRMVAAHDVRLARARLDHREHVLDRVLEGAGLALLLGEVAEAAREHADIGRVHVAVHHEEDLVAVAARLGGVRETSHAVKILGLEEQEALVAVESLLGLYLVPERLEALIAEQGRSAHGNRHGGLLAQSGPTGRSDSKYPDCWKSSLDSDPLPGVAEMAPSSLRACYPTASWTLSPASRSRTFASGRSTIRPAGR